MNEDDVTVITETGVVCEGPLGRRLQEEGRRFFYTTFLIGQRALEQAGLNIKEAYTRRARYAIGQAVVKRLFSGAILLEGPIRTMTSSGPHLGISGDSDVLIEHALIYHPVKVEEWWQPRPTDLSGTLQEGEFDPTEMSIGPRRRTVIITMLDGERVQPPRLNPPPPPRR